MVADLGKALELEKKMSTRGAKMPLKDALNRVIADYNKLVTLKRHRVDSARRAMCYNLFLIVINSCLYFFLTGHFKFQTVMFFFPPKEMLVCYGWLALYRMRCPEEALALLHHHYDCYKHEVSGVDG